jgi:hypothetical protein
MLSVEFVNCYPVVMMIVFLLNVILPSAVASF